jgi:hypothetical protein
MSRSLTIAVAALAALVGAGQPGNEARAATAAPVVREVPDRSLRDVAVAVYDSVDPVIYYNPDLMARFSPELRTFFMAHEYAHIALRHSRSGALGGEPGARFRSLQAKELEADCRAAQTLGLPGRAALLAAAGFFAGLGQVRYDQEHPSGGERAARILSCLPAQP